MTGCYAKNLYSTTVHIRFFEPFFFVSFLSAGGGGGMKGKKKLTGRVRRGDSVYRASEIRREHDLTC